MLSNKRFPYILMLIYSTLLMIYCARNYVPQDKIYLKQIISWHKSHMHSRAGAQSYVCFDVSEYTTYQLPFYSKNENIEYSKQIQNLYLLILSRIAVVFNTLSSTSDSNGLNILWNKKEWSEYAGHYLQMFKKSFI